MPSYTLIAGLLLYFLVVNMSASLRIKPLTASLIVVLGYFGVSSFIRGIMLVAYDAPLWQLFGVVPLTTVALQGIIALFAFANSTIAMIHMSHGYSGARWVLSVYFISRQQ